MTLNDRLEALFRSRPGEWIDGRKLAEVAGYAAWRTRVSNLRRRGMDIENRCRRSVVLGYDDAKLNVVPKTITISEYRYRVSDPEQLPLSDQWSVGA